MAKRVLLLEVKGLYNCWIIFDKMQFESSHVWLFNSNNIIADFQLDGYLIAVDSRSSDKETIFYKLEREVI